MGEFAAGAPAVHRLVVHAASHTALHPPNGTPPRLSDALRARQQRIAAVSLARNPADAERFVAEHRGIAEAIGRRDPTVACELVSAHLRSARDAARGARGR